MVRHDLLHVLFNTKLKHDIYQRTTESQCFSIHAVSTAKSNENISITKSKKNIIIKQKTAPFIPKKKQQERVKKSDKK